MSRVLDCLTEAHDYRLVLLAAIICLLSTTTAFRLYGRARTSNREARAGWLFLTGVATGSGIWATHFVAMMAFDPGVPGGYLAEPTLLSLVIAISATTAGFTVAAIFDSTLGRALGGALVGVGVSAMHFTGMNAFRTAGELVWQADLVVAAVMIGALMGAWAVVAAGASWTMREQVAGASLMTAAICGLHFTAMGAVVIVPDPSVAVPEGLLAGSFLALSVGGASLLVVGTGFSTALIESQAQAEGFERVRQMANAAVEGLVITRNNEIVDANRPFLDLVSANRAAVVGAPLLGRWLEMSGPGDRDTHGNLVEGLLSRVDGAIPVEVICRRIVYAGGQHDVYAVRDLRERRDAESKIRYMAEYDALTALPNRTTMQRVLDRTFADASAEKRPFAVFCIDFDRFKEINDVFGHHAGDAVLRQVAERFGEFSSEDTVFARLGGDEFVVVQRDARQPQAAADLADALLAAFKRSFTVGGHEIVMGASIGIAIHPQDGESAESLLMNADTALYRAKEGGRGIYCFFESATDDDIRDRRALAFDLGQALRENALDVHYQPLTRIVDGETCGFEALVRWKHPVRGYVSPSRFIPVAEDSGIIATLGEWVLRTVCMEAATWNRPYKVAVNLSPVQLQQQNLPDVVRQILLETGMSPERLELEVTETALIRNMERSLDVLRRLKDLGIQIAMDDFGTGYSSLSTLQSFPFDKLKIDRSFISQVHDQHQAAAIVRAVLGLSRNLEIPVVAEGVETADQYEFLVAEKCDVVQGFMFGRPMPIADYGHLFDGEAGDAPGTDAQNGDVATVTPLRSRMTA